MGTTHLLLALAFGLLSYLVGSIPFGFLAGKALAGVDIRRFGSGNIGATNVARYFGGKKGLAVFLVVFAFDVGKGLAAALGVAAAARALTGWPDPAHLFGIAYGFLAIAGHVFPVWLGFKGGKAVATSCGVMFALAAPEAAMAFGVWLIVAALTRYVSLASILAAAGLVVARFSVIRPEAARWARAEVPLNVAVILVAVLIIARHRTNIRRLLAGTEAKIGQHR